jgi:hypothetical protein
MPVLPSNDHFHESAHAVIALARGARVTRLAVGRARLGDLPILGVCSFQPNGISRMAQAEIFLAGPLIEQMINTHWDMNGIKDDYEKAASFLEGIDPRPVVERVRLRVRNLFPEIDRLATALLERGEMDEGSILRAIKTPVSWLQMPLPAWLR